MVNLEAAGLKKVLIIELTRLGDVISAAPAIERLKSTYPFLDITVLVEPFYRDILIHNPYVGRVLAFNKTNTILGLLRAISQIRKEKFSLAISLSPTKRNSLVAYFSNAKYKVGYFTLKSKFPAADEAKIITFGFQLKQNIAYKKNESLVERALKPIKALGIDATSCKKEIYIPETDQHYAQKVLEEMGNNSKIVAIHPCSSRKHKNWPKENYIKLINLLKNCDIFLLGAKKDRESIQDIMLNTNGNIHPFIDMSLLKVAALIKKSNLFIGGDSGLMHIADAVNTPIVALFGPSNPAVSGPLSKDAIIIKKEVPCSPCRQNKPCHKTVRCMELIELEDVFKAVKYITQK